MLRRRPLAVLSATALALSGFGALALTPTAQAASVPASDLMFSVYVEGSSNNKAIEVYNPTAAAVDMSAYTISLYVNGKTTTQATLVPDATIEAGGYYVITSSQANNELVAQSDATSGVTAFNGNDVLTMTKGGAVVDSIGQLGFDPGTAGWVANGVSMVNMTLTKKGCTVDNDATDAYDPSVDFAATAIDDFSTLGTLDCDAVPPTDPTDPPTTDPEPGEVIAIGAVQGDGASSPMVGETVTIQGHVVGSFQGENQFNGYYVQDAGDENNATSDGIFVYAPNGQKFENGAHVKITGTVSEAFGQTQITPTTVEALEEAGTPPVATELQVPVNDPERYEGMLVTFPSELTILEYFQYGRYGEVVVGPERQNTPTAVVEPGPVAKALAEQNAARRLIIDDGRANQNPTPAIHPNGEPFAKDNFFRGGDKLVDVTGIMSYRNNAYKLQPTEGAEYIAANPRPMVPQVGGDFTVASFNVLNYFTTFKDDDSNARGAQNAEEFERQQQKIVEALAEIDADVFGLIEIENNGNIAVQNLVAALNSNIGSETYAFVNTGKVGDDAITQALIYKPATTELAGKFQVFDFNDQKNRPNLVQTFKHKASGETVNVSINHLKSKGSACAGDPDLGDGAGNCNLTRTKAAKEMTEWLATDPTGQGVERTVILGDLNSYDHEDPIDAIRALGYTDLMKQYGGEYAYSYVFDGQIGYLDYAMANKAAEADVTGTAAWHINADEATLLDYVLAFKAPNEQNLWEPTPYRSSDHDPVIVGMQLGEVVTPEPTPAPTVTVTAKPSPAPTVTIAPSSAPTVTIPGPTVTIKPSPAPSVTVKPTPPTGDLYETPGFHNVNGRKWMTTCEPYSETVRCWTYIWGTKVHNSGGRFVQVNGWNFNNLTYVAAPRSLWKGNRLAYTNEWTATDGRQWRTECETAVSGRNGCRSWVKSDVIEYTGSGYRQVTKFVFNNIVRFSS